MTENGEVCCGECGHYDPDGCPEAAEALLREGWPEADVIVEEEADASRCPAFCPGCGFVPDQDEESACCREHLCEAALHDCGLW